MYMFSHSDDGDDCCGCTMGTSCSYHKAESDRRKVETEAEYASKGMDPYADTTGLEGIVFEVMGSNYLNQHQKDAIMRILFPAKRR